MELHNEIEITFEQVKNYYKEERDVNLTLLTYVSCPEIGRHIFMVECYSFHTPYKVIAVDTRASSVSINMPISTSHKTRAESKFCEEFNDLLSLREKRVSNRNFDKYFKGEV